MKELKHSELIDYDVLKSTLGKNINDYINSYRKHVEEYIAMQKNLKPMEIEKCSQKKLKM